MSTRSYEEAERRASERLVASAYGVGAAVMREATEADRDNARMWSCLVTDDGKRFPTILVMTPGSDAPAHEEIEARVERLSGHFAIEQRLFALLEAEAEHGFLVLPNKLPFASNRRCVGPRGKLALGHESSLP